jgi:hypothetical protein
MTRLEIATLACKILALWMFAQAVTYLAAIIPTLIALMGRMFSYPPLGWRDFDSLVLPLQLLAGQVAVGLVLWFKAEWTARRMVSHESTPVAGSNITQADVMAVAFCAVGVFTLIPALQSVARQIAGLVMGTYRSPSEVLGSPSFWSSVLVLAVSLWLIVGSHGVVRLVLWARSAAGTRGAETPGICAKCGYDLRATPDRCPECGTIPQK